MRFNKRSVEIIFNPIYIFYCLIKRSVCICISWKTYYGDVTVSVVLLRSFLKALKFCNVCQQILKDALMHMILYGISSFINFEQNKEAHYM